MRERNLNVFHLFDIIEGLRGSAAFIFDRGGTVDDTAPLTEQMTAATRSATPDQLLNAIECYSGQENGLRSQIQVIEERLRNTQMHASLLSSELIRRIHATNLTHVEVNGKIVTVVGDRLVVR